MKRMETSTGEPPTTLISSVVINPNCSKITRSWRLQVLDRLNCIFVYDPGDVRSKEELKLVEAIYPIVSIFYAVPNNVLSSIISQIPTELAPLDYHIEGGFGAESWISFLIVTPPICSSMLNSVYLFPSANDLLQVLDSLHFIFIYDLGPHISSHSFFPTSHIVPGKMEVWCLIECSRDSSAVLENFLAEIYQLSPAPAVYCIGTSFSYLAFDPEADTSSGCLKFVHAIFHIFALCNNGPTSTPLLSCTVVMPTHLDFEKFCILNLRVPQLDSCGQWAIIYYCICAISSTDENLTLRDIHLSSHGFEICVPSTLVEKLAVKPTLALHGNDQTKPIMLDGASLERGMIMILYLAKVGAGKNDKITCTMHQYCLCRQPAEHGIIVAVTQPRHCLLGQFNISSATMVIAQMSSLHRFMSEVCHENGLDMSSSMGSVPLCFFQHVWPTMLQQDKALAYDLMLWQLQFLLCFAFIRIWHRWVSSLRDLTCSPLLFFYEVLSNCVVNTPPLLPILLDISSCTLWAPLSHQHDFSGGGVHGPLEGFFTSTCASNSSAQGTQHLNFGFKNSQWQKQGPHSAVMSLALWLLAIVLTLKFRLRLVGGSSHPTWMKAEDFMGLYTDIDLEDKVYFHGGSNVMNINVLGLEKLSKKAQSEVGAWLRSESGDCRI